MSYLREIDDVINALKCANKENIHVNLLIGAGCSVTAGIPTAKGMVDEIRKQYPLEYKRAKTKNYAECMSKLTPSERRNLICKYVSEAKVNWAHLSIAQLLKHGYISRVLTTNFDNLVLRASSLLGEFPAVYDLALSSQQFRPDLLLEKSIIHLHGQYNGFILYNTERELEEQVQNLSGIFEELKQKSLWIVVGYSGQNDAILRLLEKEKIFEQRLFWVGYGFEEPNESLVERILREEKYAFYVKGYEADNFFVSLTNKLKLFPPAFIKKPFTYLNETLETITPFFSDVSLSRDIKQPTRNIVEVAIEKIENDRVLMCTHLLNYRLLEEFFELSSSCSKQEKAEILTKHKQTLKELKEFCEGDYRTIEREFTINNDIYTLNRLIEKLNQVLSFYKPTSDPKCTFYINKINEYYKRAMEFDANNFRLQFEWAQTLVMCSTFEGVEEAERIQYLKDTSEQLQELYQHEYSKDEVLQLWVSVLHQLATEEKDQTKAGDIYKQVCKRCEELNSIYPDDSHFLMLWGDSLLKQKGDEPEADVLFEAYMKFSKCLQIEPADERFYLLCEQVLLDAVEYCKKQFIDKQSAGVRFFNHFRELMKKLYAEGNTETKRCVCDYLNGLSYEIITGKEFLFDITKELLELAIALAPADEIFPIATMGLWYLRNKEVKNDEAEIMGRSFYEQAIEASEKRQSKYNVALKQKYYYELAKFYLERKYDKNSAKDLLIKAFEFGELKKYDRHYHEIVNMMKFFDFEEDNEVAIKRDDV